MRRTSSGRGQSRRGITLLEVLISTGIIAIGLTSVLSLLAAAGRQAERAVVLDRAALLANNIVADAATFGMLREGCGCFSSFTISGTTKSFPELRSPTWDWSQFVYRPSIPLVFDSQLQPWTPDSGMPGTYPAWLTSAGIYGDTGAAPYSNTMSQFMACRDDVVYDASQSEDNPPLNSLVDGMRSFEGRQTAFMSISGTGSGPYRASAVVFHNRNRAYIGWGRVSGTMQSGTLTLLTSDLRAPAGPLLPLPKLIRPGAVAFVRSASGTGFHQLTGVALISGSEVGGNTVARLRLMSSKDPALGSGTAPTTIQFLPDSVGLAERTFSLESIGVFTQ